MESLPPGLSLILQREMKVKNTENTAEPPGTLREGREAEAQLHNHFGKLEVLS